MKVRLNVKSIMAVFMVLLAVALLSACSNNPVQASSQISDQKQIYHVGDLIHKGTRVYYFGGIVYDSVVINEVRNIELNSSFTIPLYVNIKKNHIVRLNDGELTLQILDVDRDEDSVTLIVSK